MNDYEETCQSAMKTQQSHVKTRPHPKYSAFLHWNKTIWISPFVLHLSCLEHVHFVPVSGERYAETTFISVLRMSVNNKPTKRSHATVYLVYCYVLSRLSLLNSWFKGCQQFYMQSLSFPTDLIVSICFCILCLRPPC